MNRRILTIVSCALVLSICVSYLVYRAVGSKSNPGAKPQTTALVVANRDLPVGAVIRDMDLKTAAWTGPIPKGAIAKPDTLRNRGVSAAIYEGEPITENRLAQQGAGGGLSGTIPQGMRACAVRVNEVVGVAGFVVPGMRVDVLITGTPPGGNPLDGPKVRTLLQNIQVLSAGTNFQRDTEGKPEQAQVVNLLVTPPQAEILSLASNETRIQLVLRNPMDTQVVRATGTMVSDLFGGILAQEPTATEPPRRSPVAAYRPAAAAPDKSIARTEVTAEVPTAVPLPVTPPPLAAAPSVPRSYVVEELNGAIRTQSTFKPLQDQQ